MWDTAGQERVFFLVYDVTNSDSFYNISKWNKDVEKYGTEDVKKVMIGIDFDSAKRLADAIGAPFVETSAKNNSNVSQAFLTMVEGIKQTVEQRGAREGSGKVITLGGREHKEVDTASACWFM